MARRQVMGYWAALRWIIDNDDTEFLDEVSPDQLRADGDVPPLSVAASFAADIYSRTDAELRRDLTRTKKG